MRFQQLVILIQDVDAGIDRNTTQQYERGKSALVEIELEGIEGEEHTDVGDRDHENHSQWLLQRVEEDAGGDGDSVMM